MRKIRTAIIGCGKVAHLHAVALQAAPNSHFVAVCANKLDKAKTFAQQYNVAAYDDIAEMREKSGVEMVCICTPHPQHADPTIAAANAGIHALVEKPLAITLADCDRMIAAANKNNVQLATISQRRFYEPCQRIRRAIDANLIGKPALGIVTMYGWRDEKYYKSDPWRGSWKHEGGGVLVNQAPHQLDLLLWYMGDIDQLTGYHANLNHPYIEVEDTALAIIRFKNGSLGNIVVSNSQNPALYGKVHIFGTNGHALGVQTDGGQMFIAGTSSITEPPYNDLWTIPNQEPQRQQWQAEDAKFFQTIDATNYFHAQQIQDFLEAILQNRPPLITATDGRKTVELFTAIYRSQSTHQPITFPLQPE